MRYERAFTGDRPGIVEGATAGLSGSDGPKSNVAVEVDGHRLPAARSLGRRLSALLVESTTRADTEFRYF